MDLVVAGRGFLVQSSRRSHSRRRSHSKRRRRSRRRNGTVERRARACRVTVARGGNGTAGLTSTGSASPARCNAEADTNAPSRNGADATAGAAEASRRDSAGRTPASPKSARDRAAATRASTAGGDPAHAGPEQFARARG